MPRIDEPYDEVRHGNLVVEKSPHGDCVEVYYIPSQEQLSYANLDCEKAAEYRVKLLEWGLTETNDRLTMFPINTFGTRPNFLNPKYRKIERITLANATPVLSRAYGKDDDTIEYANSITFGSTKRIDRPVNEADVADVPTSREQIVSILESLPSAFTKDYDYGLGLAKPYRFIIEAIEDLCDCTEIVISDDHGTELDGRHSVFYISTNDFDQIRRSLNSTTNNSRTATMSVKHAETYNFFAEKLRRPTKSANVGRHPLRKRLTALLQRKEPELSENEQEEILGTVVKNVRAISQTRPHQLASLQRDIDLVNLQGLISRFEEMLGGRHNEGVWQNFLNLNPFILSLAFGYPIIKVQEKASVGGRTLSGKGDKFTDFLVKNSMTNNTAIIEIKTPDTKLLNSSSYRDEVFTPSGELSGAINQALDQKYRLEKEIAQFKENSGQYDLKTYSVNCCLIIGVLPTDEARRKSFELFRGNSKDVAIVTFDELLQKLRNLQSLMASPQEEEELLDIPF